MRRSRHVLVLLASGAAAALAAGAGCGLDLGGTGLSTLPDGTDAGRLPGAGASSGGPSGPGGTSSGGITPSDAGLSDTDAAPLLEAGPEAGPPACPAGKGPAMVRVPAGFCVDATEVTNTQYLPFYEGVRGGTIVPVPPVACVGNGSYRPGRWSGSAPYFNQDRTNEPVDSVDWCDATAFCQWAGKRLCGKRGGGERPLQNTNADPAVSEYFYACSADGTKTFPYGATYADNLCNGRGAPGDSVQAVGALTQCVGGYPGLFDLSGNVAEWENACQGNDCVVRGGSFNDEEADVQCAAARLVSRGETSERIGFRCCAD